MKCRLCKGETIYCLALGDQPLANRFLTREQLQEPEPFYPLTLYFCKQCFLFQLGVTVPPEQVFTNYAYASSTSASFRRHFEGLAYRLVEMGLKDGSVVVEPGSNDGVLLRPLKERGIRAIGVEPAQNICELAWKDGLETRNEFFTKKTVQALGEGTADAVVACNVYAHVPEIKKFTQNVKRLLKLDGFFCAEVQYVRNTIEDLSWDNAYLEHLFYWSLSSLQRFLGNQGMRIFCAERIPTHGGSLRFFADKKVRPVDACVRRLMKEEEQAELLKAQTYYLFGHNVMGIKLELVRQLKRLKAEGMVIVGYGAPAKATTLTNYCGIGPETIDYIVDDSPLKQGLFSPGKHIPILGPEAVKERKPDIIFILAWNFKDDIIKKTRHLGVPYLLPVPPRLVDG